MKWCLWSSPPPPGKSLQNQNVYLQSKKKKRYILYIRGNTLALLELPQTLRFSEFPAAILQWAENTAQKHSTPVLIRRKHIFTFFKIDMFCLKSEFTVWEVHSINNMFSLSFIGQEPYETSEYTMTLLAPNSDWNNRDVPSSSPMDIPTPEEGTAYLLKLVSLSSYRISLLSQEIMMQCCLAHNYFVKSVS